MNEGLILLVEDDPRSAELTVTFLHVEAFTDKVVLPRDGVDAIDYLFSPERSAADMPRLVFLDLNMPGLDGMAVLKKVRQEERTRFVPVLMLISSDHPEDLLRAHELGANGYLDKLSDGVRWNEMVRTVASYWVRMTVSPYSLVGQDDGQTLRA